MYAYQSPTEATGGIAILWRREYLHLVFVVLRGVVLSVDARFPTGFCAKSPRPIASLCRSGRHRSRFSRPTLAFAVAFPGSRAVSCKLSLVKPVETFVPHKCWMRLVLS